MREVKKPNTFRTDQILSTDNVHGLLCLPSSGNHITPLFLPSKIFPELLAVSVMSRGPATHHKMNTRPMVSLLT